MAQVMGSLTASFDCPQMSGASIYISQAWLGKLYSGLEDTALSQEA